MMIQHLLPSAKSKAPTQEDTAKKSEEEKEKKLDVIRDFIESLTYDHLMVFEQDVFELAFNREAPKELTEGWGKVYDLIQVELYQRER